MSDKKLHNEEFDVIRADGNVLSGDSNKIKLKMTSYAIVMEVQEAFMQEEIKAQEDKQKELNKKLENDNLSFKEKRETKKELAELSEQINNLNDVYAKFSESRTRFMEIAKKALKLPEENLKQLAENGSIEIEEEKIDIDKEFEKAQNILMDAQDDDNIFTNVDTDAIKEEVDRAMNEKDKEVPEGYSNNGDFISQHITADTFDKSVRTAAEDIKEKVDKTINNEKQNEITKSDMADIFANARGLTDEESKTTKEEPKTESEDTKTERPTIEYDIPPIARETGEWTSKPTTDDNKSFTGFDNDKSIESFIKDLEDRNASLKAHGEELNSQLLDVKDERKKATKKHEQAIKERDDAKRRAEEAKKQIELLNSYKPKMDELRKANAEQEKLNNDKEDELRKENENLAEINTQTTALETEASAYDEETSKALEELKRLRAEFSGTGYSDNNDSPILGGGRTK